MKFALSIVLVLVSFAARADMIGYGTRNCNTTNESRGLLNSDPVCIQRVRCEQYALSNPSTYSLVSVRAYCRPGSSGRCPSGSACIADPSIRDSDIARIRPMPDRPIERDCDQQGSSSKPSSPQKSESKNPFGTITTGNPDSFKGNR
ncbi:MAG: hypothetical protein JSU04_03125 [Bdellovibrionales bacterium]|nr:hypothetical protein [Bdellovibrionales bacterium]